MGEIADMMLEGDLCAGCGVALDGKGFGVPRYCSSDCEPDDYKEAKKSLNKKQNKVSCPICKKKCNGKQGVLAHIGQLHGGETVINIVKHKQSWDVTVYVKNKLQTFSAEELAPAMVDATFLVESKLERR